MNRSVFVIAALTLSASAAVAQPMGTVELTEVAFPDGLRVGGATWTAVEPHRQGVVTIDGEAIADLHAPRPLGELAPVSLLAPFWHVPDCPVQVETTEAPGELTIAWVGAAGCDGLDFALAIEHRREDGEVVGGARVTFTYRALPNSRQPAPRAGVVVGQTVLELMPDGERTPPDRAKALLDYSSAGTAGTWVVEFDAAGFVVGDDDLDGVREGDNCVDAINPLQEDLDGDGLGDPCDHDVDGDRTRDVLDNCPLVPNADQRDADADGVGDACEDEDGDGLYDPDDLCPGVFDPAQLDLDGDHLGDECDLDIDGDDRQWTLLKPKPRDLCPYLAEDRWRDGDGDGLGDGCDRCPAHPCEGFSCLLQLDSDGDGVIDLRDRRPTAPDLRLRGTGQMLSECGTLHLPGGIR